ncbi:hypothetical protein D3C84_1301950 [compost metagenome]
MINVGLVQPEALELRAHIHRNASGALGDAFTARQARGRGVIATFDMAHQHYHVALGPAVR